MEDENPPVWNTLDRPGAVEDDIDAAGPEGFLAPSDDVAQGVSVPPPSMTPASDVATDGPATRQFRHADPDGPSAPSSFRMRPILGIGLVVGIPTTLMFGVFTVLAYRDGQLWASLAFLAFMVLLGLPVLYWSVRLRLVANEQGLFVAKEFRAYRIPWSDLDFIELVFHPGSAEFGPSATLWLVTRQGMRISPTTGTKREDVPWLARILIAMRDEYSPEPCEPGAAAPTNVASTPSPGLDHPTGGAPPPRYETRRVVVVRLREASGNAAPPDQLRTWRGGFKADRDGIRIRGSIKRIPWRDVEGIDFDSGRTASESDARVVLVTRGHGRIHLPHLTGSPTPGHKAYETAQTLLAMRDAHTSEGVHPGATPTDTATPSPVVPPLAYASPPETEPISDGDPGQPWQDTRAPASSPAADGCWPN